MRRLAALCCLALLALSCGGQSELHVIDSLPDDLYASPTPAPEIGDVRVVRVWFLAGDRLTSVRRQVMGTRTAYQTAMADLLAGPTPEEEQRGLSSAIPKEAELLGVELTDGVAVVDLSKEFELSAEQSVLVLRLAQVVYTMTDLPRTSRVRFEIDGQPVSVIGADGNLRGRPVSRDDYAGLTARS